MVCKLNHLVLRTLPEMTNFKRYFILSILLLGVFSSCSEELDFDQIDDIAVTPTLEGPLVYVEAPEDVINLAPAGAIFYEQEINFDAFNKRFCGSCSYLSSN